MIRFEVLEGWANFSLWAFALADFSSQISLSSLLRSLQSGILLAQGSSYNVLCSERDAFPDPRFRVAGLPSHDATILFCFFIDSSYWYLKLFSLFVCLLLKLILPFT